MIRRKLAATAVSRRGVLASGAASLAAASLPRPAIAAAKPYSGVTIHGASYQHRFFTILQKYIPEFEESTGMKVDLQLSSFPVYNQQADLELSSGGSAYDFVNVTFILASRWIAAGLLADLDEFTSDANLTPASWKPDDFLAGAQLPYRDQSGKTYGYAWEGGAMVMGVSRMDLMEKKGLAVPKTFDELQQACAEINGTDAVTGFVSFQLQNWCLPPYMQGYGGNVFKNPPSDITPTLDTPEAVQATTFYANLLKNYAPRGVLTYTEDQARQALLSGRSNIFIHSIAWISPMLLADDSKVKATARVVRMPAGPKADHPGANSQGLGIPKNAKNKKAAWAFIEWALSPELLTRIVADTGHASVCRRSVIESEVYRKRNTVNGQDLGALYMEVLDLPAKENNYMAYRTVKEFPLVGDVINKAVEQVVSGQMSAEAAMQSAQDQAVANLRRAGIKL